MTPDLYRTIEGNIDPTRRLYICSGGRGGIISNALTDVVPSGFYPTRQLVDPQISIDTHEIQDLTDSVTGSRFLKELVTDWLKDPTEGRPLKGKHDYIYGASGIESLANDVRRIAMLKFRAVFPQLISAFHNGRSAIQVEAICRDTGQLLKDHEHDLFLYQSHPGPDRSNQVQQYLDLFKAEYALIATSFIVFSGSISTDSIQHIFDSLALIYMDAFGLDTSQMYVPKESTLKIFSPTYITAWRVHSDISDPRELANSKVDPFVNTVKRSN